MKWKKDFYKLLFNNTPSADEIQMAQNLKFENLPKTLFKYYSYDSGEKSYGLSNLENDLIHFQSPLKFNDPYDSNFSINIEKTIVVSLLFKIFIGFVHLVFFWSKDRRKYVDGFRFTLENQKQVFNRWLPDIFRENTFITCFAENNDSLLMWSHYSGNHKGFCIGYDISSLSKNDLRSIFLYPVYYVKKVTDLTKSIFFKKQNLNVFKFILAALTKSQEWRYEKEWRIIFANGQLDNEDVFPAPAVEAVYLGANADTILETTIKNICIKKQINLYRMELSQNKFLLKSKLIYSFK